jgi:hypothetical protein
VDDFSRSRVSKPVGVVVGAVSAAFTTVPTERHSFGVAVADLAGHGCVCGDMEGIWGPAVATVAKTRPCSAGATRETHDPPD